MFSTVVKAVSANVSFQSYMAFWIHLLILTVLMSYLNGKSELWFSRPSDMIESISKSCTNTKGSFVL